AGEADKAGKKGEPRQPAKPKQGSDAKQSGGQSGANEAIDFTLQDDQGKALAGVKVTVRLASGEAIEATTDSEGKVHIEDKPAGAYTVEMAQEVELTSLDLLAEDAAGNPTGVASGTLKLRHRADS